MVPNPQRVLVADDERIIADTLERILSQDGFKVAVAYDGQTAVKVAQSFCPQIVLCDIMMPGMNGLEAAVEIRRLFPRSKILLFSGQASSLDLVRVAHLRGDEFELILKPIHPSELLDRLHSF